MQALPDIGQEHTREPTAQRGIRRQAVRTMAEGSTQLRTVASIRERRIPITETAITKIGGLPTVTAFTSRFEVNRAAKKGNSHESRTRFCPAHTLQRNFGNGPVCDTAYQTHPSDWLQGRYAGVY